MSWLHELDWPGVTGGFIGRSVGDERRRVVAAAMADMGGDRTVIEAEQVHGGEIAVVAEDQLQGRVVRVDGVDGLVTDAPDAALAIYVADCLAVYLADTEGRAVGLAHAGWRGLVADIPGTLVATVLGASDGARAGLRAALSPCIRKCCFEVGEEVAEQFDDIDGAVDRSRDRPHVDMIAVAAAQLRAAGVPRERIDVMPGCTRCEPERFASYRWDPERCGRNVALIGSDPEAREAH